MISFVHIHVILTYLVKIIVGAREFIDIRFLQSSFFIVFDLGKCSLTDNPLTLQGKTYESLYDNLK